MLRTIGVTWIPLVVAALSLTPVPARAGTEPTTVGSEFQVNTYTTDVQIYPAVGSGGTGEFVVVWQSFGSSGSDNDFYSIQGQRYAPNGSTTSVEFQVNTYTTSGQSDAAVGPDGAGGFVVVWQSFGSSGSDDETFSIQGQRYASDGSTNGIEFQVNTYTTNSQYSPTVSPDGAGGFVVVWISYGSIDSDNETSSIQGQRYASDGSTTGVEFQVNTYTTSFQSDAAVGPDGAGGFVVVWQSFGSSGNDDSTYSIQGQHYASDGSTTGVEFQVNTYTTSFQGDAVVGPNGTGGFVIFWNSFGSSGSDDSTYSIQGQHYTSDGSTTGIEFQVNTHTTSFQSNATVGPDGAGGFVVVWDSYGSSDSDDSTYSIQGQRYRVKIFEDGFESGDTSAWSNTLP